MPLTLNLTRRRWHDLGLSVASVAVLWAACQPRLTGIDVGRVELTPPAVTVQPSQPTEFSAVAFHDTGDTAEVSVTWSTTGGAVTNLGVRGRRHLGRFVSTACGTFRIAATARPSGRADTSQVTVTCPPAPVSVASVTVSPTQASVDTGKTVQLTATPRDATGNALTGRVVTWTSGHAAATVSGSGLVRGMTAGSATITATSEGRSGTSAITVVAPAPVPVASVTVSPAQASVDTGKTVQLTATPRDASGNVLTGRVITWTSGNTAAAPVSGSGLVRGVGAGSATITATSEGQSGTSAITVVAPAPLPVASVTVSPAAASVVAAGVLQLTATPRDASGNPLSGRVVTWASSNTAAATVTGGLVTGVAAGSATITATSEGQTGSSAITVTAAPPPGSGVVFVGAGDIAGCSQNNDEATAKLLDGIPGTVFTAGDNAYPDGTDANFAQCYDPTWGRHKARTRPSPGNHDYHTSGAAGYYNYFGANAGPAGRGYYSYDLGDWHIISLNSNISMSAGSIQEQWLRADLAANPKKCVLAYWHHPRFSSGSHGSSTSPQPLWQALYDLGADVVIAGHDHNYQRFAPQTPTGQADPVRGIRQFLAGMGGQSHYNFSTPIANTEAFNTDTDGVLKLTLFAESYTWEFIPVAGKTYRDSGNASCH